MDQLLAEIDGGSIPGTGLPLVNTISPQLPSGSTTYDFPVGALDVLLTASTCAGTSTCASLLEVTSVKPKAVCVPTLALPATTACAAHNTTAELLAAIDRGSTPGSGGPLSMAVSPGPATDGTYTLPVGTFTVSLTVSNCAGTDTCSTLVTVADQLPLQVGDPARPALKLFLSGIGRP